MENFLNRFFVDSFKGVILVFGLALGIVFLYFTKDAWCFLIKEKMSFNWLGKKLKISTSQQKDIKNPEVASLKSELAKREIEIRNHTDNVAKLVSIVQGDNQLIEEWQFRYLYLFFVWNTKAALLSFLNTGPIIKEVFLRNFTLSAQIPNPEDERKTILNVLLDWGMLEQDSNELLKITEKGIRFLRFLRLLT